MKVLIDFLPLLPRGGGLQNALNLWRTVSRLGGDDQWLAVVRPDFGLPDAGQPHAALHFVSLDTVAQRVWYENVVIPRLVRSWGADVVWTPMGAGPLRSPVPRVMGWHDSSIAYPESIVHRRIGAQSRASERVRGLVARAAARGAARVTVQTATMRDRLSRVWGVPRDRFVLVPNGPSTFLEGEEPRGAAAPEPPVVLVVAEAKPAKNLEIVPEVARLLRRDFGHDVRVVVTVPPEGPGAFTGPLDAAVRAAGEGGELERVGRVPHALLGDLYRSAAVVFLPSLLESFSATYVEAMHFGVPLVTSDMDFARDLCGDAAVYADPLDAGACAAALQGVLTRQEERSRLREAGFRRVSSFPTWERRFALYRQALESAVRGDVAHARPAEVRA